MCEDHHNNTLTDIFAQHKAKGGVISITEDSYTLYPKGYQLNPATVASDEELSAFIERHDAAQAQLLLDARPRRITNTLKGMTDRIMLDISPHQAALMVANATGVKNDAALEVVSNGLKRIAVHTEAAKRMLADTSLDIHDPANWE